MFTQTHGSPSASRVILVHVNHRIAHNKHIQGASAVDNGITIIIMSGYADGERFSFTFSMDDTTYKHPRQLNIGRNSDNDISLNKDAFVSRLHAKLSWQNAHWLLQDCGSTNGTFIENADDILKDVRVTDTVPLKLGQMFRVGRTWMCIQPNEAVAPNEAIAPNEAVASDSQ